MSPFININESEEKSGGEKTQGLYGHVFHLKSTNANI